MGQQVFVMQFPELGLCCSWVTWVLNEKKIEILEEMMM
jgi:hypothetical protein